MKIKADIAISIDGFAAGPNQTLEKPMGDIIVGGRKSSLHEWMFDDAESNQEELNALKTADAFIMGRNMFGPDRGEFDLDWNGWWGDEPPYHAPVFVLSHYKREPFN